MNIFDQLPKARLDKLVEDRLINKRSHPELDYDIYSYSKMCVLGQKWEPWTIACRGLILDRKGEIIARPIPKFFNHDDGYGPNMYNKDCDAALEKLDGSLGIVYYPPKGGPKDILISTKGSFDSEQAYKAIKLIRSYSKSKLDELYELSRIYTSHFEIVYPQNRIVVDYGMQERMVFLCLVQKDNGGVTPASDSFLPGWDKPRIIYNVSPKTLIRDHTKTNEEGWVLFYSGNHLIKVKNDEYKELHRMVTNYRIDQAIEQLKNDWDWEPDEELSTYEIIEKDRLKIVTSVNELVNEAMDVAEKHKQMKRKEFAIKIAANNPNRNLWFHAYDMIYDRKECEKSLRALVLKTWKKKNLVEED